MKIDIWLYLILYVLINLIMRYAFGWVEVAENLISSIIGFFIIKAIFEKIVIKYKDKNNTLEHDIDNYNYLTEHHTVKYVISQLDKFKTVVLTGKQGSGKSTVGRQIAKKLRKDENYLYIEIKTWDYDGQIDNPLKLLVQKIYDANIYNALDQRQLENALNMLNSKKLFESYDFDKVNFIKKIVKKAKLKRTNQKILFLIDELDRTKPDFIWEFIECITLYLGVEESNDNSYSPNIKTLFANKNIKILYIFDDSILVKNLPKWWKLQEEEDFDSNNNRKILSKHFNKTIAIELPNLVDLINPIQSFPNAYHKIKLNHNARNLKLKITDNSKKIKKILESNTPFFYKLLLLEKLLSLEYADSKNINFNFVEKIKDFDLVAKHINSRHIDKDYFDLVELGIEYFQNIELSINDMLNKDRLKKMSFHKKLLKKLEDDWNIFLNDETEKVVISIVNCIIKCNENKYFDYDEILSINKLFSWHFNAFDKKTWKKFKIFNNISKLIYDLVAQDKLYDLISTKKPLIGDYLMHHSLWGYEYLIDAKKLGNEENISNVLKTIFNEYSIDEIKGFYNDYEISIDGRLGKEKLIQKLINHHKESIQNFLVVADKTKTQENYDKKNMQLEYYAINSKYKIKDVDMMDSKI